MAGIKTQIGTLYTFAEYVKKVADKDFGGDETKAKQWLSEQSAEYGANVSPYVHGHELAFVGTGIVVPDTKKRNGSQSVLSVLMFKDKTSGAMLTIFPSYLFKEWEDVETKERGFFGGDLGKIARHSTAVGDSKTEFDNKWDALLKDKVFVVNRVDYKKAVLDSKGILRTFNTQYVEFNEKPAATTNGRITPPENEP